MNYDSAIIFCRTRNRADRIGHMLHRENHAVAILHSNRTQREREQALRGFRDGRYELRKSKPSGFTVATASAPRDDVSGQMRTARTPSRADAEQVPVPAQEDLALADRRRGEHLFPRAGSRATRTNSGPGWITFITPLSFRK